MHHILILPPEIMELESDETIFEKHSVVTGHHVYKGVWTPIVEKVFHLEAEDGKGKGTGAGYTACLSTCSYASIGGSQFRKGGGRIGVTEVVPALDWWGTLAEGGI